VAEGTRALTGQENKMNAQRDPDMSSTEAIQRYVEAYDYDNGYEGLMEIVKHTLCDRGTALTMFWRSGAAHLLSYAARQDVPVVDLDGFDLVKGIEARYLADTFTNRSVLFNPRNDRGTDWTADYLTSTEKLHFNEAMLQNSMVTLGRKPSRTIRK